MERNWAEVQSLVKTWIKEVRPIILESFDRNITIETKENLNDLVTEIDRTVEKKLSEKIKKFFPEDNIVGEEGTNTDSGHSGYTWYIDPIDGTMNFVHQQENFCISVGIYKEEKGQLGIIYDVVNDIFYTAIAGQGAFKNTTPLKNLKKVEVNKAIIGMNSSWLVPNKKVPYEKMVQVVRAVRGVRSYGSACIELAMVAQQKMDAYLSLNLSPWDFAAGKIIVEELGGVAINLNNQPLDVRNRKSTILIGNKNVCENIVAIIKGSTH